MNHMINDEISFSDAIPSDLNMDSEQTYRETLLWGDLHLYIFG